MRVYSTASKELLRQLEGPSKELEVGCSSATAAGLHDTLRVRTVHDVDRQELRARRQCRWDGLVVERSRVRVRACAAAVTSPGVASGSCVHVFSGHADSVSCGGVTPDGKQRVVSIEVSLTAMPRQVHHHRVRGRLGDGVRLEERCAASALPGYDPACARHICGTAALIQLRCKVRPSMRAR